jgi:hypothetical protein
MSGLPDFLADEYSPLRRDRCAKIPDVNFVTRSGDLPIWADTKRLCGEVHGPRNFRYSLLVKPAGNKMNLARSNFVYCQLSILGFFPVFIFELNVMNKVLTLKPHAKTPRVPQICVTQIEFVPRERILDGKSER